MEQLKKCNICGEEKPLNEYYTYSGNTCKCCKVKIAKDWRDKKRGYAKVCPCCNQELPITQFQQNKKNCIACNEGTQERRKECVRRWQERKKEEAKLSPKFQQKSLISSCERGFYSQKDSWLTKTTRHCFNCVYAGLRRGVEREQYCRCKLKKIKVFRETRTCENFENKINTHVESGLYNLQT